MHMGGEGFHGEWESRHFLDVKASYARSKSKFFVRNTRATGIHCCIINQNSVTKMTRVHENFILKISIYTKVGFSRKFSLLKIWSHTVLLHLYQSSLLDRYCCTKVFQQSLFQLSCMWLQISCPMYM